MEQGEQGEMIPVTLTAHARSTEPADQLEALAEALGRSIRVCLDAGQISPEQAERIAEMV
jgi:D-serine deaminase-like pyridoxal phosphate-dependent protein